MRLEQFSSLEHETWVKGALNPVLIPVGQDQKEAKRLLHRLYTLRRLLRKANDPRADLYYKAEGSIVFQDGKYCVSIRPAGESGPFDNAIKAAIDDGDAPDLGDIE